MMRFLILNKGVKMRKILLASVMTFLTMASAYAGDITGAGSSFAAPIYTKWAAASTTGVVLNYQSIGSGAGINQITNRTVDFGATDMPLSNDRLKAANLAQFPTAIGGVVVIVNIPGVTTNTLKLTGEIVSEIYSGKITKWNDPKITYLNSSLNLPNLSIAPVYRADGSGTTFVFTDYLSLVSPNWKSTVGAGTSVKWLSGTGAKGNDGISATVAAVKGSIGYVESAYADGNHLTTTQLKNHDGHFVSPTMETFRSAAASADWSKVENFSIDLNNQKGANSWPIESATFILIPTNPTDAKKNDDIHALFKWALNNGDDIAIGMKYVPLPETVKTKILKSW
jgi:phosphate transport system substrate-binding protein